jgi:H+/Cl- antiporter ClcA
VTHRLIRSARYRRFFLVHTLRHGVFWIGAVSVAGASILFAKSSSSVYALFRHGLEFSPLAALAIAPIGLGLARFLTVTAFPGAEGSGVPQVIAAISPSRISLRESLLSLRIATGKVVITVLGLASGASIGREGPSVQVGAAIMYNFGKWARLPPRDMTQAVVLAGGAAGISAAFNTPLAGIVFAIEELSRSFEERTSGRVFTAVIVSGIVSLAVLGNYTYFGHTDASLDFGNGWTPVLVCGVAGGLMGGAFARLLIMFSRGLPGRIGIWQRANPVIWAALCGSVLALIGLVSGSTTYGTGYDEATTLLAGQPQFLGWGPLKFLATLVSYCSGIPGGIFAPSLAVGAGIGSDLARYLPGVPFGAVVILAMVSYFTGVVQAPITAVVIMLEMIGDETMTIPIMAAALIAFSVSRLVCPKPLYKTLAASYTASPKPVPADLDFDSGQ